MSKWYDTSVKKDYLKKVKLPDSPGVYFFKKGTKLLYIGKATSLRSRAGSYFLPDVINTRGPLILDMVTQADRLEWQETDSVLEALILEANLIKKYQPKYNTKEKDNKSFNYVVITNEEIPKVLVLRGRNLLREIKSKKYQAYYGPFPNGIQLRDAMKIIRRMFPFIDAQSAKRDNAEFYRQLGLSPNIVLSKKIYQKVLGFPRSTRPDHSDKSFLSPEKQYIKNITNLKLFFEGKKKRIISNLKKEMLSYAKKKEFEKAGEIKKRIFALGHINDVALMKDETISASHFHKTHYRIEAYDIAHMSGKNMVGVMIVIENGEPSKNEYKKFIIRTQFGVNDTGALEEVLSRRFRHTEWGIPNLIVVDGSTAQMNVAKRVLNRYQFEIPVVSIVKDNHHKAKAVMGNETLAKTHKKEIILANSEAHRFAITFHRKKRSKNMFSK